MRGSALLLTIIVTATLTVLGLAFLLIADTETIIASSDRNQEQLVHVAETGARMVKAWFDQPVSGNPLNYAQIRHKFLGNFDLRNPYFFDRTKRLLDHDGDPNTPRVLANGTASRPYYRQDRTIWAPSTFLDFFHKPFRGDMTTTFMGSESGPDMIMSDDPALTDILDVINSRIFSNQEQTGRISEIAIYEPPIVPFDGVMRSAGIATVRITATKYSRLTSQGVIPVVAPGAVKLGQVRIRVVLSEVPGTAANGPLESCGALTVTGALKARWGKVIAAGDIQLSSDLDGSVASAFPYESFARRISGYAPGDDYYEWSNDADVSLEDPWLKVLTSGDLTGHAGTAHPYPYTPGDAVDSDHSNLFQQMAGVDCGRFGYDRMKSAAAAGEEAARYFAYDPGTGLFREWGVGPARSVRDWTHNEEGLYFFDTKDGMPPNGIGPGNPGTNLTPPLAIQNVDWNFSGLLYLNAESLTIDNVAGATRVLIPPGEPFDDVNGNGAFDPGETFVNLQYPTTATQGAPGSEVLRDSLATQMASQTSPDLEFYSYTTTTGRDPQGIPILATVNLFGVLYNAGNIVAEGSARHYGSLIAGTEVVQTTSGADSPEIIFDERLNSGSWPPAEITFPRTQLSRWVGPS